MNNKNKVVVSSEPFVRRHRTFFVGLFVIAPLIMMPALLIFTILKNDMMEKWCVLHAVYENSQGLKNGNQVTMSGITIGHVKRVDLIREKEVCVRFDIRRRYNHLVKKDTRARLKQKGFVGDWEIELTGGNEEFSVVTDGDTILTENVPTLDWAIEVAVKMLDTATIFLSHLNAMATEIHAGKGTIGQFLNDDILYRNITQMSANTVNITTNLRKLSSDAHGAMQNVNNFLFDANKSVNDITAGGLTMMDTLLTVMTTVKKSLNDAEYIMKNFKTVSDNTPEFMDRLQDDLGQVELMIKSLQKNWFFRGITGGGAADPKLIDKP
ncbi:MAG: MlaD family protein [Chitinispirillales bacterium]|jgi:phospholipid/cholesterol/gamma-HCH transport system substrate-binding protein|nr:MlaD family protein [Chitinispirillales bacterium]